MVRRREAPKRSQQRLRTLLGTADRAPASLRRLLGLALIVASSGARPDRPIKARVAIARAVGLRALGRGSDARAFAAGAAASSGTATSLAMARFLEAIGSDTDGLKVLRSKRRPGDPNMARRWGLLHARIARRLGRYSEALAAVEHGLRLAPHDPRLLRHQRTLSQILERFAEPLAPNGRKPVARIPGRILWLTYGALPTVQSGYTLRTQQAVVAQRDSGLDPHVLVLQGLATTELAGEVAISKVPYHYLPGPQVLGRAGTARGEDPFEPAAAVLERLQPSAIHATTPFLVGRTGLALGRRFGLPVVYEVRGFVEDAWLSAIGESGIDADQYVLARAAEAACMKAADAVVTLGEAMKAEIVERGVTPDRVTIVPNVVDSERFVPGPRDPELARELGIADHEVVVGYVSSFQPYEDLETFVRAIARLHSSGRPVRGLWVGGEGVKLAAARQRVAAAGMDGVVLLPGRVAHAAVPRYHRLIDIFAVPRPDHRVARLVTPLKPFEAMASGRPIVVSRLPALLEMIAEGVTGLSYEAEQPDDLALVLDRLIGNPTLRDDLGRAARAWVVVNRTMERTGAQYAALYERLGVSLRA